MRFRRVSNYKSLTCRVSSFVESFASAFLFNFYQVVGGAGVERYDNNRGFPCHKFVGDAFFDDVPDWLGIVEVEEFEFNLLVANFCPSVTLYDSGVLNAVWVIMGRGAIVRSKDKNPCGSDACWKPFTDQVFR